MQHSYHVSHRLSRSCIVSRWLKISYHLTYINSTARVEVERISMGQPCPIPQGGGAMRCPNAPQFWGSLLFIQNYLNWLVISILKPRYVYVHHPCTPPLQVDLSTLKVLIVRVTYRLCKFNSLVMAEFPNPSHLKFLSVCSITYSFYPSNRTFKYMY